MRRAKPRKAITASSVEVRSYVGSNEAKNRYILIKGHLAGRDYFNVFLAHELKGACIDILGLEDSQAMRRRTNANKLARKVWDGSR
jgi:hypothetical protein